MQYYKFLLPTYYLVYYTITYDFVILHQKGNVLVPDFVFLRLGRLKLALGLLAVQPPGFAAPGFDQGVFLRLEFLDADPPPFPDSPHAHLSPEFRCAKGENNKDDHRAKPQEHPHQVLVQVTVVAVVVVVVVGVDVDVAGVVVWER